MTPAVLALPSGLFRLQCHLKSLFLPPSIPPVKTFSSSLALDTEETPAMKALKDIPYPSASPDPSIFEPRSDEYNGVRLPQAVLAQMRMTPRQKESQRYNASRVLEQLSRGRKLEEAEQVRQELVEMNVPIRWSRAYYSAALNVLRQRPWPPNRAELLRNWLSLLPTIDKKPLNIVDLESILLFGSRHLDLKTIAQFGIVLSSKGYIRKIGASIVSCLTRYADPDISSRILDEMIAANDDYSRSIPHNSHYETARKNKRTTRRLWSVAVRTHCTAGRPEAAFQMVKRAHEQDFRLTGFTYEFLLGKLDADGLDDLAAELRAHPCCESLDVAKNRLNVVDVSNSTSILPISRERDMFVNQATALAILQRNSQSGLPAYAVDLVPYFDIYKTHLRGGRAVNILRSRAYRISLNAASAVLLAELLHHHRRGQFRHILWLFEKFFHDVGVHSEDITRQLWKRVHYPPRLHIHPWHIPARITQTTFNLPSKLWPTHHHTALVWSALAHLCMSEDELFALYDSLLQHSSRYQKTTGSSSFPAPVPATAVKDKLDAAHFRPFLIAFTQLRDAKYSLRVLDDMQNLGIAPSAQFLSTTAALQARQGEPALALRMLDIIRGLIERQGDEEADVEMEMGAGSGAGAGERVRKSQKLLSAYTGVLRGLVDRRDLVQARRVAELLHSHLGYGEGRGNSDDRVDGDGGGGIIRNARTDAALLYLRRLEVKGPNAIPESPMDSEEDADYFYPFLKKRNDTVRPPILFYFSILNRILPHRFSNSHVSRSASFPMGKPVFAMCCFSLLRLTKSTAQLIEYLNAAPGTNRDRR